MQVSRANIYFKLTLFFGMLISSHGAFAGALVPAIGAGYGGNERVGKIQYDNLKIMRDAETQTCYLKNDRVVILNLIDANGPINSTNGKEITYPCRFLHIDPAWYWDDTDDSIFGGYSPNRDALFGATAVYDMYQEWYGEPIAKNPDGSVKQAKIYAHYFDWSNAQYQDDYLLLGDGSQYSYPFTSPGVFAFLLSHWFTDSHSNLSFAEGEHRDEPYAIRFAFSMVADQAIKIYLYGKNDWQIGAELSPSGKPIYYIDLPSKDGVSIDHVSQYKHHTDPFPASGIYRRGFYLLATSTNWNTKKAFDVMVQANMHYWNEHTTFNEGLCGMMHAASDLHYEVADVVNAFAQVGVVCNNT